MSRLFVTWLDVIEVIRGCLVGSYLANVPEKFFEVLDASMP